MKVRVSDATAGALGLSGVRVDAPLRTAYFMTYSTLPTGKCVADCSFCTLATSSGSSPDYLSRVRWMPYELTEVASSLRRRADRFRRACLQVVNYPGFLEGSFSFLRALEGLLPTSVSVMPVGRANYRSLRDLGVDRITIPMDAATPPLFDRHKGRRGFYRWERHLSSIRQALEVFGAGNVYTYLIVGLGESDEEAIRFLLEFKELGVQVALHSFTAVPGLSIEGALPPPIDRYRGVQLARYLIFDRGAGAGSFVFSEGRLADVRGIAGLEEITNGPEPYLTSGCPDCNRPFYNERVRGPLYNLPYPLEARKA
jgi:biotin synthase-related radical SAM superfamily protein